MDGEEKKEGKEGIDSLRERLYARGSRSEHTGRTELKDHLQPVRRGWDVDRMESQHEEPKPEPEPEPEPTPMPRSNRRGKFRLYLVVFGLLLFAGALGVGSIFMFTGQNSISGENIQIDVSGPFSVGGGETINVQVAVSNFNAIPIESAQLNVIYPSGSQSAANQGKEIYSEAIPLRQIDTGEMITVDVPFVTFGEEEAEKIVNIEIEYRVRGSNATFSKKAQPLRYKISSSPVVLIVDSVEQISSGQETQIILTVASNSTVPLNDILIEAEYPFGFDYLRSDPDTASGQNIWRIDTLAPEEEVAIIITGVVVGKQNEDRYFTFNVGVPNERDPLSLASIFTSTETEISLEQPFLDVAVSVNNDESETVIVGSNQGAGVSVSIRNDLNDVLFDGAVEVELVGNAVNDMTVDTFNGFYSSIDNTVRFDSVDVDPLKEILPGESGSVSFSIYPKEGVSRTPQIELSVRVKATRVFEDRVPQELTGTANRTIRIESVANLSSSVTHTGGPFTNTGPVPPKVEELTQYTVFFNLKNGSNDITDAQVTAILPQYVTWLDLTEGDGRTFYNPTTREVTWSIGDLDANQSTSIAAQVSILPSATQIDDVPILIRNQYFKATDRFTGTEIRDEASAITTTIKDPGFNAAESGRVVP